MKAITFDKFGGPEVLYVSDNIETPVVNDEEVLIKVHAAGINRPDILQRMGQYPPPRGCLLYTSPSPRDRTRSRMPSSA